MKKEYFIKIAHRKKPKMIILIGDEYYDFKAKTNYTHKVKGSKESEPVEVPVKAFTQEHLEKLYNDRVNNYKKNHWNA